MEFEAHDDEKTDNQEDTHVWFTFDYNFHNFGVTDFSCRLCTWP